MQGNDFVISKVELITEWGIALTKLIDIDLKILGGKNQNERSIAYRLVIYLHERFSWLEKYGIYIDGEYNRDDDGDTKRPNPKENHSDNNTWIAPDIILHERGSAKNNYRNDIFYCEIKKNSSDEESDDDRKIKEQMKNRKYQFGINIYKLNSKKVELKLYTKETLNSPQRYGYNIKTKQLEEL
ncbi:hypothetical protein ACOBQJ_15395 [Pelotomaculum propionicicum]|uniref:hypothetical protein n=1 Tax=Pelotomaculum propionicicum TaxID=258475 RepID=UPI003B79256F